MAVSRRGRVVCDSGFKRKTKHRSISKSRRIKCHEEEGDVHRNVFPKPNPHFSDGFLTTNSGPGDTFRWRCVKRKRSMGHAPSKPMALSEERLRWIVDDPKATVPSKYRQLEQGGEMRPWEPSATSVRRRLLGDQPYAHSAKEHKPPGDKLSTVGLKHLNTHDGSDIGPKSILRRAQ